MEKYEEEEEKWKEYLEKGEKGYLQLQADSSDSTAEYRGPFYTNPAEWLVKSDTNLIGNISAAFYPICVVTINSC